MQNSKPMTLASFAGTGGAVVGGIDGVPCTVIGTPEAFDGTWRRMASHVRG